MAVRSIEAGELLDALNEGDAPFLLDVREPDEFEAWRIAGAVNLPLGQLALRLDEVPRDREVVTVCAAGTRATTAAERLAGAGLDAIVLNGGMGAWSRVYDDAELRVGEVTVVQVRRRGKGCLSYLVGSGSTAVVIDPSCDLDAYRARAAARGWTITRVIDTHLHADHVSGARQLAALTGARLCLNPLDPFDFEHDDLHDGEDVPIGDSSLRVSVLATPGHTRGSTTLVLDGAAVFTGDVLFLESVGRPDLADKAEEFAHCLYDSLHSKVLGLGDDAWVLPAHAGAGVEIVAHEPVTARLGDLRDALWQLQASEDEFVAWAISSVTPRPPNYLAIVEANRTGTDLDAESRAALEAGPNRCAIAN